MAEIKKYIAVDLGAESGRVMLGSVSTEKLILEEIHRFRNGPIEENLGLKWVIQRLMSEIKEGLRKAVKVAGTQVWGIGVDSWGVDFGLLDALPRKPFVAAQKAAFPGGTYLAPELRQGEKVPQASADIYSLGVIIGEMITGQVYPGPDSSLPEFPAEFSAWQPALLQALNEQPARRQSSTRELFEQIITAGKKVSHSRPPSPPPARREAGGDQDAPSQSRVAYTVGDKDAYPPTVVNAQTVPDDFETISDDEVVEEVPETTGPLDNEELLTDEEIIEETGADEEFDEELQEVEELMDDDDGELPAEEDDEFDEGETLVSQPTPTPAVAADSELRVAKPVQAPRPVRKSTEVQKVAMPVAAPAQPATTQPAPVPGQPQGTVPSYGPFSQPPFPPSFVSQPPLPRPSRTPVYIFLAAVLLIVGVGVYFLVDYLRAQTELARAQAQAALQKPSVSSTTVAAAPATAQPVRPAPTAGPPPAATSKPTTPPGAVPGSTPDTKPLEQKASTPAPAQKPEEPSSTDVKKAAAKVAAASTSKPKPKTTSRPAAPPRRSRSRPAREERRSSRSRPPAGKPPAARSKPVSVAATTPAPSSKLPVLEEAPEVQPTAAPAATAAKPTPPPPVPPAAAATKKPSTPRASPVEKKTTPVAAAQPPATSKGKCPRGMVYVPAGTAYIGSASNDPMRNFGEIKLHAEKVGAFCIDRYEYPNSPGRKPLTGVNWKTANKLCRKRGKRLCTEQEWEFACKGNSNRSFPYGNKWDADKCNTEDASGNDRTVTGAGAFPACRSPRGVFDMSGNVSEWTKDNYRSGTSAKTYKGGSATRPNWASRCASRSSLSPGARKADLGFRCCANPK